MKRPEKKEYNLTEEEYDGEVDVEDLMEYHEIEGYNQAHQEVNDYRDWLIDNAPIEKYLEEAYTLGYTMEEFPSRKDEQYKKDLLESLRKALKNEATEV